MRVRIFVFGLIAALAATAASAHGPQIQITNDDNKIVTRALHKDGDYSLALTAPKSVYVMPLVANGGVWYSKPNNAINPVTLQPALPSGPGLAYGYDLADGGPQAFAEGSVLSVGFLDGLKSWNGAAFADAGATQLKAFRGSNASITSPPENLAITSDSGPFDSLSLAAVAANYGGGAHPEEVHSSLRWAMLGDGTSPTSAVPDGVYLLKLQLSSTQNGLAPSDPYYFVLHKNAEPSALWNAVNSLGFESGLVNVVPEPTAALLAMIGLVGTAYVTRRRNRG
jgi:hypothetical protein